MFLQGTLVNRNGSRHHSSSRLRWEPQHRPRHPRRQRKLFLPHEGLKERNENVGRRPSTASKAEVVLSASEPRATEMPVRVGQSALLEVVVDIHTAYLPASVHARRVHDQACRRLSFVTLATNVHPLQIATS